MEFQKIINVLDNIPNQASKSGTKFGLEEMMTQVESITPIVKLNLKINY